ncbi:MAG: PhzF family phenazine biosynthesis protein [Pirellulaceae bacterium]
MTALFQVDAFTEQPFAGNPAAVCLLKDPADAAWMQNVAAEMNLAETAFVCPEGDHWRLRWFTPMLEVDLCGHATLATSHVLWENDLVAADAPCVFQSNSGELRAQRDNGRIQLDFPAAPAEPVEAPAGMVEALGVPVMFVGKSPFDFLAEVDSAAVVRSLDPDMRGLLGLGSRGVIVTARDESGEFDFISRFFGPGVGIDEDPVTGSAHCTLGPYWSAKLGKTSFNAWQASPRGGGMRVTVDGDRIKLLGNAITVLRGELCC